MVAALTPEGERSSEALALTTIHGRDLNVDSDTLYKMINALANPSHSNAFIEENLGYWLLYPFALLLLFFFRKGFNLYWSTGLFLLVNLTPQPVEASWLDWVMTPDQQGAYYFTRGDYQEAALRFDDEKWQAAAFYHARQFDKAANIYRQQDDLTSLYNLASSYVKMRNYSKAIGLYQLLLEIEPDNSAVQKDLAIITRLVDEIKRLSESQQEESPPNIVNRDEMMDTSLGADKQKLVK